MTPTPAYAFDVLPEQPRVLLVDDDEVNLLLTGVALRERGFCLQEVNGGQMALDAIGEKTPDIVVLDAMMPGMDGFETCRRLRALPGLANVPVLMLTGLDDDASITRAYEAGATDFMVKATQWSLLAGRLFYLLRAARTRLELERSRAKLARAQDLARMGSFDWGRASGQLQLTPEAMRVFGMGPYETVSLRTVLRRVQRDARGELVQQLKTALRRSSVLAVDLPFVLLDGRQRNIRIDAEPEFDLLGRSSGYTGIVQDVTDRHQAEDRINQLANFDALTGLPNRRQLLWRAERALEYGRRAPHQVGLLLVGLDRFKNINDTLGHAAGDELLMEVGRRLRACVRHSEQLTEGALDGAGAGAHRMLEAVGRLSGDEFVALLPEVLDDQDAQRVAQRALEALRAPIIVGGQECFVTASVGVAIFPQHGQAVADLLRNCSVAMYSAKAQGKDSCAIYSPHLAGSGRQRLELETALHKAMERDEMVLHYQPKVDVRGSRMVGAEALMRWRRGDKLVPPGDFIPLAEETGLIVPLSEWALREAAHQARLWQKAFDFDDAIAVNLPGRIFERTDLIEHIHQCVTASNVPHRAIQLEITENNLMKELQNVIPSLHRLNEIGVEISIDDFGTGYSSLAYLTTLPISELKIDRSFVRELGIRPESSAVVSAIIALARSLGLRVVAEGVETLRQMEVLNRLGCTVMQGFLFSRGVAADELQYWLEHTVLPRKAPWIGAAPETGLVEEAPLVGVRRYR
jgi:predicted signal transduction protein with EAL and GGDEF domain/DNA-binding response OmpR family regulator